MKKISLFLTIVVVIVSFSVNAQNQANENNPPECVTYFSDDECTTNLELQYILPVDRNNRRFIEKGIKTVVAKVYIGNIYKTEIILERDVKDINIWRKNINVKTYNNLYYKFKYQIITNQKKGLRKNTVLKYTAGSYRQSEKFREGYEYTYKTDPYIHIPHGSIGIGSIGYTYSPLMSETTVYDNYSLYGSLLNTISDFGIGLKLGINVLEWNYYPFDKSKLANNPDYLPGKYEKGVHIFSFPKIMLLYDFRLYKHIPVPSRTFRPYHFTLSPYIAYKPVEWAVFVNSYDNYLTFSKSIDAGFILHSSLYFIEVKYSYRYNDIFNVNGHEINLKNPGSISFTFGISPNWYN